MSLALSVSGLKTPALSKYQDWALAAPMFTYDGPVNVNVPPEAADTETDAALPLVLIERLRPSPVPAEIFLRNSVFPDQRLSNLS